jgi:hypothetical protein
LANTAGGRVRHALPFSGNRFEIDNEHTYFLESDWFQRLQTDAPKPVYLTGPRGTGKTTLLMAFNLKERRTNHSLRDQLGGDPFASPAGPFLGVYIKVPEIQLGLIEAWGRDELPEEIGKVLALYIDLQWLLELTRVISGLLAEGELIATTGEERAAVAAIVAEFPRTFEEFRRAPQTVAELWTALKRISGDLDVSAKREIPWRDAIAGYDAVQQPGGFGRFVATQLATLCKRDDGFSGKWHFRICIDEADFLTDLQLRALNSTVRLCRWPVFPVAAFGGVARDFSSTLFPHLSNQAADCDIIDLSGSMTAKRFKQLAEGVAGTRVKRVLREATPVDLDVILGTFGINGLLERLLSDSVSPQAKALLESAESLQASPFFRDSEVAADELEHDSDNDEADGTELPIYQAYLVQTLGLELPDPEGPAWKRRRQDSAELRKRMIAAYLSICGELKTHVRYASARIVLRLSDLCIRDFLKFLDALHRASGLPVQEFVTKEMLWRDQHDALLTASNEKIQSIRAQDLRAPRETHAVVKGLAKLTHLLQAHGRRNTHLRTSERGIFFLPADRWRSRTDRAALTIREACDTGFLRFLSEDDDNISFRVHTSLAPAFQFSYRGAYYPAPLLWSDIEKLSAARQEDSLEKIADGISARLSRTENLSLFETG